MKCRISIAPYLTVLLLAIGVGPFIPHAAAQGNPTPTVVELFTSEGCSSCPPAEALLRDLADQPNILALEFHVDYWDYIGWADPYADPVFTKRQRDYAKFFRSRTVYTPQMVFQGVREGPGSRPDEVLEHLAAVQSVSKIPVFLSMTTGNKLELQLNAVGEQTDAEILLLTYDDYRETMVTRGENSGKTLTHRQVVRSLESMGSWDGTSLQLVRAIPATQSDQAGCAVLIQDKHTGRILGAASIALNR